MIGVGFLADDSSLFKNKFFKWDIVNVINSVTFECDTEEFKPGRNEMWVGGELIEQIRPRASVLQVKGQIYFYSFRSSSIFFGKYRYGEPYMTSMF